MGRWLADYEEVDSLGRSIKNYNEYVAELPTTCRQGPASAVQLEFAHAFSQTEVSGDSYRLADNQTKSVHGTLCVTLITFCSTSLQQGMVAMWTGGNRQENTLLLTTQARRASLLITVPTQNISGGVL